MNFLSSLAKGASGESTDESKKPTGEESSLFASAKVLVDAAQSQVNKDASSKVDNKKVAEAAADVLDAAQKYGKLDETQGVGQYVEKAETYLHQYGSTTTPAATTAAVEKPPAAVPETEEPKAPAPEEPKAPVPTEKVEVEKAPVTEGEGGNASDYLKMAGDFLNKK